MTEHTKEGDIVKPAYYEEWKTKYGQELLEKYARDTGACLKQEREQITVTLKTQFEDFLRAIRILQGKTPFQIGCIQGALLYSSVKNGNPVILYEAFDEAGEYGKVLMAKEYPADWLFVNWGGLWEALQKSLKDHGFARFMSEEAVNCLMNEQISSCVYALTYLAKYIFKGMDQFLYFDRIQTTDDFYVTLGGYQDFCKCLYRKRKEVDIFVSIEDRDFTFCNFRDCVYQDKKIWTGNFNNAVFTKCRFQNVDIVGCEFRDCEFKECSFQNVTFVECALQGCIWMECSVQTTSFLRCEHQSGAVLEGDQIKDICRKTTFLWSELTDVDFGGSSLKDESFIHSLEPADQNTQAVEKPQLLDTEGWELIESTQYYTQDRL